MEHRATLDSDQRSRVAQQLDRGGEALPEPAQRKLGPLYGERLSDVRLHRGAPAEDLAAGLSAKAFTVGTDIFWPRATLDPSNVEERSLLSHELAHAVSAKSRGVANSVERQPADAPTTSPDEEYLRGALVSYSAIAGTYAAAKGGKRRIEDSEVSERLTAMRTALGPIEGVIFGRYAANPNQPATYQSLRAQYQAAVTAIVEASAATTARNTTAIYRAHEGELPEWAVPHVDVPEISTPLPLEAPYDVTSGEAATTVGDLRVVFQKDSRLKKGERIRNSPSSEGETSFRFADVPAYRYRVDGQGRVSSFTFDSDYQPTVFVSTTYVEAADTASNSAYGRGTTREDVAANTKSLRFHEGNHGLDFYAYVKAHPFPAFPNVVGMTVRAMNAAISAYRAELQRYSADMDQFSKTRTDCVGSRADFCSP
jgi:hypothetical protein